MNGARGFSTEYRDHAALIMQISRKCQGRLNALGIYMDLEDIYQENCLAYTRAVQKYDPSHGVTFTAYMGRAIYNQFNRFVEELLQKRQTIAFVDMDEEFDLENVMAGNNLSEYEVNQSDSIEHMIVLSDEIRERVGSLSKLGKLFVRELISPSEGVQKTFDAMVAHAQFAKQMNMDARAPTSINTRVIKRHYGLTTKQMRGLRLEFKQKLGVEIG